ncbi:MAG TPA: ATP-binding protein [Candidatus Acidoferrum sp.]|nr:ATP-binding protein [Candidatus Acidoferrum sp.]
MRFIFPHRFRHVVAGCGLMLVAALTVPMAVAEPGTNGQPVWEVTHVQQVIRLGAENSTASQVIRLEGIIWWASPAQGRLVLADESGVAELQMELAGQSVETGQRVRLEGNGTISREGAGFRLGARGTIVDNDGVHDLAEKSGTVYLKAGRQPIRVDWFNGVEKFGLEVEYEGPNLPRQKIPDAALFRLQPDASGGASNFVNGLDYRCYEVPGAVLPDFSRQTAIKSGTVVNFDLSALPHPEHVGIQFTGWLDVPRDGLYTFHTKSDDGSQLFVGVPSLHLAVLGQGTLPGPQSVIIGQTLREGEESQWAQVEGKVTFLSEQAAGMKLELSAGADQMRVEIVDASDLPAGLRLNSRIRATGFCESTVTADGHKVPGVLLVSGGRQIQVLEALPEVTESAGTDAGTLPVLTSAAEVHRLKREEAQRGYPVKIRGVVTCVLPEHQAFVLQDASRGLYVEDHSTVRSYPPQIGEFLKVEGVTDPSLFAPIVHAQKIDRLGEGHLPAPVLPAWDQLLNGSLDAQYVEVQGIITAVQTNGVTLLTQGGRIKLELRVTGLSPEALVGYENALVRIRGCLLASWDYVTHEVRVGEIRIYGADVSVDQPAPADLFAIPGKTAAQLLLFDPQASVFQRVKVSGQILFDRDTECYMTDGRNGLRFTAKKPEQLAIGDLVEVVGFPELSGALPLLREAVARKTGRAALPEAKSLPVDNLVRSEYDSTRVKVKGVLVSVRATPAEQVLEIQNGLRTFVARLAIANGSVGSLPAGSQLELSGVYSGQGGNRAVGQDITSFELLLNSPADIVVLARPPWWTLERLLIGMGALACVLAVTVLWITQLHRKVESRTAELEVQIRERQRIEHQRALEQERARIAQDLHDELGSGITEISMLVTMAGSASSAGAPGRQLEEIGDRARQMVTALDEIVWAMNPKHDSLMSLVSYSCLYADRLLKLANIACQLKGAMDLPDRTVSSVHRHEFFLAFKEAITNVIRHAGATEVRLGVRLIDNRLRLSIADNGQGLPSDAGTRGRDGLANMRLRLEKLGGRFAIASQRGRGTIVRFYMPLD